MAEQENQERREKTGKDGKLQENETETKNKMVGLQDDDLQGKEASRKFRCTSRYVNRKTVG